MRYVVRADTPKGPRWLAVRRRVRRGKAVAVPYASGNPAHARSFANLAAARLCCRASPGQWRVVARALAR